jgi:hypothetical protein
VSRRIAELQVLLEGVALPASKDELLRHSRKEKGDAAAIALLQALPDREYGTIDEVAEALEPVQPPRGPTEPDQPHAESGLPPGGPSYTEPSPEPGAVRERGPEA